MAALDSEFEFVAASVSRSAEIQRAACVETLDNVVLRNSALVRHLQLLYESVEKLVGEGRANYALALDDTEREDLITEMRSHSWDVRGMQSNLRWLDAAAKPQLDLGTTYYVEQLAREMIAKDAEVTVVATEEAGYATTSDPWSLYIEKCGEKIPPGEPTVVVVYVPRREQASGLLHPLIVHELAHAVDSEHRVVSAILTEALKRKPFMKRFVKAVTDLTATGLAQSEAVAYISFRLNCWIAEAFCDALAILQLGPTYLYSFTSEVLAGSLDEASEKHPPSRQRVRLMLEHLDRAGWTSILMSSESAVEKWLRDLAPVKPAYTAVDKFLVYAVEELRAVIRRHARKSIGRPLDPDATVLAEIATLIDAGIPPAQLGSGTPQARPVVRELVILACWVVAMREAGGGPASLATAPDNPILASLLPATLELAALTELW